MIGTRLVASIGPFVTLMTLGQSGEIAWFSRPDSFPDIHLMVLGDAPTTRRLTHSADTEYGYTWSPDGRLLAFNHYVKDSMRMEVLDLANNSVIHSGPWHLRVASWAPDGSSLLMVAKDTLKKDQVFRMAWPGGELEPLTHDRYAYSSPRFSPDGTHMVYLRIFPARDTAVHQADGELMIMDLRTREERRLEGTARFDGLADWSPDGAWIAYHSCDRAGCHLRMIRPDGTDDHALMEDGFDNDFEEDPMNAAYESWAETLDTLADPEEMEAILEGEADVRAGNVVSFEEVFGEPQGNAPIPS